MFVLLLVLLFFFLFVVSIAILDSSFNRKDSILLLYDSSKPQTLIKKL